MRKRGPHFDRVTRELWLDGRRTRLEPKAAAVLNALIESKAPLSRTFLLDHCWTPESGSDEALTQAVAQIRRALRDDSGAPRYVATIPRHGYRWIYVEREPVDGPRPALRRWILVPAAAGVALLAVALGGGLALMLGRVETETVTIVRRAGGGEVTTTRRASNARETTPASNLSR